MMQTPFLGNVFGVLHVKSLSVTAAVISLDYVQQTDRQTIYYPFEA